jgi:hypothetical protein
MTLAGGRSDSSGRAEKGYDGEPADSRRISRIGAALRRVATRETE